MKVRPGSGSKPGAWMSERWDVFSGQAERLVGPQLEGNDEHRADADKSLPEN